MFVGALYATVFYLDLSFLSMSCKTIMGRPYQVMAIIGPIMCLYGHFFNMMSPHYVTYGFVLVSSDGVYVANTCYLLCSDPNCALLRVSGPGRH